jgi:hypothetical protein
MGVGAKPLIDKNGCECDMKMTEELWVWRQNEHREKWG